MDSASALQRRERTIAIVRWLAVAFAVLQVQLYRVADPALQPVADRARSVGFALAGFLALVGIAVELVLRRTDDVGALRRLGAVALTGDVLASIGFVVLYAFDPRSSQWTLLSILPLEAALRSQLAGAIGAWAVVVPGYLLRELVATRSFDQAVNAGQLSYRGGLLLIIALFAGFIARDLEMQRRLLQRLVESTRVLAGRLDHAEILTTLCEQAELCLDAVSAVVYVYDTRWFQPVASSSPDILLTVIEEDSQEHADLALVEPLLKGAAWLPSDGVHPPRLSVPLRWRDQPATHLLVIRTRRKPNPFEVDAAQSLAEAAAQALTATRVLLAEQRSNQRLRYLEALRTRFVATIAHDLRAPLTVFKGVSRLLRGRREDIAPGKVDEMLSSVERQANRLSRLADDLLDAARMDADLLVLHPEPCDLASVIAVTASDIDEDVDVEINGDLVLVADAARVERVLWNLLSNAQKYGRPPIQIRAWREEPSAQAAEGDSATGSAQAAEGDSATGSAQAAEGDSATGGAQAAGGDSAKGRAQAAGGDSAKGRAQAAGGDSAKGWVAISIRDHGKGVSVERRGQLFEEFAGSEEAGSVGLGLAIVWQLVTAHGGTVTYEEADPGARFVVRLPPEPVVTATEADR